MCSLQGVLETSNNVDKRSHQVEMKHNYEVTLNLLSSFLPPYLPKSNEKEIILSTVRYLKELSEKLTNDGSAYENVDDVPQSNRCYSYDDEETLEDINNIIADEYGLLDLELAYLKSISTEEILENKAQQEHYQFNSNSSSSSSISSEKEVIEEPNGGGDGGQHSVKRPGNGFIRFSIEKRKDVAKMHPHYDNREISRILGSMWKRLPKHEKCIYNEEFEKEMEILREAHPEWNYAGSRAKTAISTDTSVILSHRLRPRSSNRQTKHLIDEIELPMARKKKSQHNKRANKNQGKSQEMNLWVMCDLCECWRKLPPLTDKSLLPVTWNCSMNPNQKYNTCNIKEEPDDDDDDDDDMQNEF